MSGRLCVTSFALCLSSAALSQGIVGGQVNFGGYYNRTTVSGGRGNASITSYGYGGGIGLGASAGYGVGYGGYSGGSYGYGYGCAPLYLPYSPFTRTYGNPCYPAAVVVPSSACVVPVYPEACGQFIVR